MGLNIAAGIDDFIREAIEFDLRGKSLLMLGYQHVYLSIAQFASIVERAGIYVDYGIELKCTEGDIDAISFFRAIGFTDVHAMDISDYEDADIIFDLNSETLPQELYSRFDYIVDGGTLEHVFDVPNALRNIVHMLKDNGCVYHYVPADGFINHGYWLFSPSCLTDFYTKNNFQLRRIDIILNSDNWRTPSSNEDYLSTGYDYRWTNFTDVRFRVLRDYGATLRCIARKKWNTITEENPIQTLFYYQKNYTQIYFAKALWHALKLNNYRKEEVAIWGMGVTATGMYKAFANAELPLDKFLGFFATDAKAESYLGRPVLDINRFDSYGIKVVLIASMLYQEEIYESISWMEKEGVQVIGMKQFNGYFEKGGF